jgi:hypothetical protein
VVSILDRGNAEITVYPEVEVTDEDGNVSRRASEAGVTVEAMVWQYEGEVDTLQPLVVGQQVTTIYRVRPVRYAELPVGPWSRVEWDGREWDVDGEPNRHRRGVGTRRLTFSMRARTPGEVPGG